MAYAVKQDIIDRYGSGYLAVIADHDDDGTADDTAITKALDDATAEINGYLAVRFGDEAFDLDTTDSPILIRICVDLAVYQLAMDPMTGDSVNRGRYEQAIKRLEMIRDGKLEVDTAINQAATGATGTGRIQFTAGTQQFTRTKLDGVIL